jgi:hypothetical protein
LEVFCEIDFLCRLRFAFLNDLFSPGCLNIVYELMSPAERNHRRRPTVSTGTPHLRVVKNSLFSAGETDGDVQPQWEIGVKTFFSGVE